VQTASRTRHISAALLTTREVGDVVKRFADIDKFSMNLQQIFLISVIVLYTLTI